MYMLRSTKQYSLRRILLKKISTMLLSEAPPPQMVDLKSMGNMAERGWGGRGRVDRTPILLKISISILLFLILWARWQIEPIFELRKSKVNFKTKLLRKKYFEVATGWYLSIGLTMTKVIQASQKVFLKISFFELYSHFNFKNNCFTTLGKKM